MKTFYLFFFITFLTLGCKVTCEDHPKLKDGTNIFYYPNGNIKEIVQIKDCVLSGIYLEFYENGNIKMKLEDKAGVNNYRSKHYDVNGKLITEKVFENRKIKEIRDDKDQVIFDFNKKFLSYNNFQLDLSQTEYFKGVNFDDLLIVNNDKDSFCIQTDKNVLTFSKNEFSKKIYTIRIK